MSRPHPAIYADLYSLEPGICEQTRRRRFVVTEATQPDGSGASAALIDLRLVRPTLAELDGVLEENGLRRTGDWAAVFDAGVYRAPVARMQHAPPALP